MRRNATVRAGSATRRRVVRVLMAVAAASAMAAAGSTIPVVADAGASVLMVETWRLYGFLTFAGLFALLGWRPLRYPGLWEIVIVNKLLLTVTAGGYALGLVGPGDVDGAAAAFVWDGGLTVVLLAAYVTCRGWRAWRGREVDAVHASAQSRTRAEVAL